MRLVILFRMVWKRINSSLRPFMDHMIDFNDLSIVCAKKQLWFFTVDRVVVDIRSVRKHGSNRTICD
jgi:hypothetical protein